jgi:hypothetical protein
MQDRQQYYDEDSTIVIPGSCLLSDSNRYDSFFNEWANGAELESTPAPPDSPFAGEIFRWNF